MVIENPILRGFHPDPGIVRVGADYYIATSTFEWWPGVRIHHSKDLAHWECIGYALTDTKILDLKGVGASQGIWAPDLSYADGQFTLLFTVVHSFYCNMYDTINYLVTAPSVLGPWSDPVPLNNFGFDPSMFHDDDGRSYMVSIVTDHRVPKKYAGRIILQEYSYAQQRMIGEAKEIYVGDRIFLEGPHIYKRHGWYYLFAADTGTGELHGQSILRSRNVYGPYEMYRSPKTERTEENEAYSILTSRHHPDHLLQKSGHADLVETPDGDWYLVHLCGRALPKSRNEADRVRFAGARRYPLGRETALQRCHWTEDDWLELDGDTTLPRVYVEVDVPKEIAIDHPAPAKDDAAVQQQQISGGRYEMADAEDGSGRQVLRQNLSYRDGFLTQTMDLSWQSLRIPMRPEYHYSLTARAGYLRLYGREGLSSKFNQTLFARRMDSFTFETSVRMEFHPRTFKQMAGLILMYDTDNYLYLHVTHDEDAGSVVTLLRAENKAYSYPAGFLKVPEGAALELRAVVRYEQVQFMYRTCGRRGDVKGTDETAYADAPLQRMTDGRDVRSADPAAEQDPSWKLLGTYDLSFLSDEACEEGWFTGAMIGLCCQDLSGAGAHADFTDFRYVCITE